MTFLCGGLDTMQLRFNTQNSYERGQYLLGVSLYYNLPPQSVWPDWGQTANDDSRRFLGALRNILPLLENWPVDCGTVCIRADLRNMVDMLVYAIQTKQPILWNP